VDALRETVNEPNAGTIVAMFGIEPVIYGCPAPDEIFEVQIVVFVPVKLPMDFK
jgi:hypothetical protein